MTVRVAEPGEAAVVDFGVLGLWVDPLHERPRTACGVSERRATVETAESPH